METEYVVSCKSHLLNKTELFADIKKAIEDGLVIELEDRIIRNKNGLSKISLLFSSTNKTEFKGEIFKYEYKPLNITEPMIEVNGKLFKTIKINVIAKQKVGSFIVKIKKPKEINLLTLLEKESKWN